MTYHQGPYQNLSPSGFIGPVLMPIFFISMSLAFAAGEDALYKMEHSGSCNSWNVAFYSSGFVHESWSPCYESSRGYSRLHRLTKDQLQQIEKVFKRIRFTELPDSIEPNSYIADEDFFVIEIQRPTKKKVTAIGLDRAINRDYAYRFQEVWKTISSIVKEPSD